MFWFRLIIIDACLPPLRNSALTCLSLSQWLSLEDIDYLKLIELVIAKGHAIVKRASSHLTNTLSKMLRNGITTIEPDLFFTRTISNILCTNAETITIMDDYIVCYEIMGRKHLQRIEMLRLFQCLLLNSFYLVKRKFFFPRVHTSDDMLLVQFFNRHPNLLMLLCKDQ
jgi:hypothetical protein